MSGKNKIDSITRRDLLRTTAGGVAASAFSGLASPNTAAAKSWFSKKKKPNVIVLFDDQLRADVCGVYDGGKNITTPNIDKLAGQGMTFTNAVSTCPLCTPFRGMLQTVSPDPRTMPGPLSAQVGQSCSRGCPAISSRE